jgi:hypothetical protein
MSVTPASHDPSGDDAAPDSRFPIPDSHSGVSGPDWPVWLPVALSLSLVYVASIAPTVTLWDAGEFQAAIASLGIPHPPGTPLYLLVAHVWATALGVLPLALAVNLLSAVATATACALLAVLMTRWTRDRLAGIAGGISAGTMLAVWQNATETEIYALSMLLGVLMVVAGERAGARDSRRYRILLAYLMGLSIPIQISALVAAPAAILLASSGPDRRRPEWGHVITLGGVLIAVIGVSQGSVAVMLAGLAALAWTTFRRAPSGGSRVEPAVLAVVAVVAMTPTLFMLVRAAHDPLINQGNPSTFGAMLDVVWRRQYPLPGLWPRRSPIWVQLLAIPQYADWQVASGLDQSIAASWRRMPWNLAALFLALTGARWHFRRHLTGARAAMVLFLAASLGVVTVMNWRAGPSIMDGVLPPGTAHEPRERDYFFYLAFATVGLWVGAGAVLVSRRIFAASPRLAPTAALLVAGLPVLLNWRAASRRPEGMLATTLGESLLASSPPNAVLLVAGDNDSYTIWYRQSALRERRDVVPVTISLLPATWYRDELARRYGLLDSVTVRTWQGDAATLRALVDGARRKGRPMAAALTVSASLRAQLAPTWTLGGMVFVADHDGQPRDDTVDSTVTRAIAELIDRRGPRAAAGRDPAARYVARILRCPAAALQLGSATPPEPAPALLDSRCNFK